MDIRALVEERSISEISTPYVNIVTDDARLLIGVHARTLIALEYLAKRLAERSGDTSDAAFFLDVNGYRLHQLEGLKSEAKSMAKKVRLYRTEFTLQPMSAFERRIVHMALSEYPDITTQSVGEGVSRRVVIKPYP
jgi:spoIIIJ-associated protein